MDIDTRIQSVLDDLYALDPSLREHEAKVRSVVAALVESKPDVILDEEFRLSLRAKVIERAHELSRHHKSVETVNRVTIFSMSKVYYALGGAALVVVLMVPVMYLVNGSSTGGRVVSLDSQSSEKISFIPTIREVSQAAFGKLIAPGGETQAQDASKGAPSVTAVPESAKMAGPGFGGGGGGFAGSSMIMPPAEYVQYRYVYTGDELKLDGEAVKVLKRSKGGLTGSTLAQFLKGFNFEGISLKSFGDAALQNLNFIQNKPFGYNINISLSEGNLSIGENWEQWYPCTNGVCPQFEPLTIDRIPSDDAVIALAQDFVKEYGIDVSRYGTPEVQNEWRVMYERAAVKEGYYIPDMLVVVYPLVVDGKPVYEDGGMKVGIRVNVNVRLMKVSGIWDVNTQKYESSSYTAETDVNRILKVAERGGIYGYMPQGGTIVDVELGTPEVAYLKYWNYRNGVSDELLVPSLIFPITKLPTADPGYYRKAVIVPLAQELLVVNNDLPVTIQPMPLTEPAPVVTPEPKQ